MSLNLVFVAGEGYVEEFLVFPELPECNADVGFEVIPSQAKLLICHIEILDRDSQLLTRSSSFVFCVTLKHLARMVSA